jgi:hypothetical protein
LLPNNRTLILGWAIAAGDWQRVDWIEALLTRSYLLLGDDFTRYLLQSLSRDNHDFATRFFTKILTADNFADNMMQTIQVMINHDESWNAEVSALVVQQFHKHIYNLYSYQQRDTSLLLGRYLDVSVLPDLQQMQSETEIEDFSYAPCIELLEFRRDMRSAFNTA